MKYKWILDLNTNNLIELYNASRLCSYYGLLSKDFIDELQAEVEKREEVK